MIRAGSLWTFPDIPRFPTRWGADDRFQRPHGAFDTQITARLSHRTGGTRLIWLWNNVGNLTQKLIFINFPTMWNIVFWNFGKNIHAPATPGDIFLFTPFNVVEVARGH